MYRILDGGRWIGRIARRQNTFIDTLPNRFTAQGIKHLQADADDFFIIGAGPDRNIETDPAI